MGDIHFLRGISLLFRRGQIFALRSGWVDKCSFARNKILEHSTKGVKKTKRRKIREKYFRGTFNSPTKWCVIISKPGIFPLYFNFNTCIENVLKRRNNYKSIFEREMCIFESNSIVTRGTIYTENCNVYLLRVNVCTTPLINLSKIYIKLLSSANNWPISKAK